MTSIRIEGVAEVLNKIKRVEDMKEVRAAMAWSGQLLQRHLKRYPKQNNAPNPILRERSERGKRVRGYFFANKIKVPYKRTGNLRNRWTVVSALNGMRVVVGNNAPYAQGVQDASKQWRRHEAFPTIQSVKAEHEHTIVEQVRKAVRKELRSK